MIFYAYKCIAYPEFEHRPLIAHATLDHLWQLVNSFFLQNIVYKLGTDGRANEPTD